MRIIGGRFRRTTIPSPPGSGTRPTMDSLRESIFEVIEHHIQLEGATILDLYAGSGILSWEALSRGAERAILVDTSAEVCRYLRGIATDLGVGQNVEIIRADALAALTKAQLPVVDCLFADPPYARRDGNRIVNILEMRTVVSHGGLVVIEHGDQEFLLPSSQLEHLWQGARSSSIVDILRCVGPNP